MLKALRFAVAALVAAIVLTVPVSAVAAPIPWQLVDITLHNEQQQSLLLVAGELPSTTPLPFDAELAVPAGMQLEWIGEILGGAPEDDPTLQYTKETVDGRDVYRFTLTRSRIVQIEGVVAGLSTFDGTTYSTNLAWTATQDVPSVRISQRLPLGAAITQTSPAASLMAGDENFSYYSKTVNDVKAGQVIDLAFGYTAPVPGASPAGGGTAANSNALTIGIVLAAVALMVGIIVFAVRQSPPVEAEDAPVQSKQTANASAAKRAAAKATSVSAEDIDDEPAVTRARSKTLIPTLAVIVSLVGVAFMVGAAASKPAVSDGLVSKDYGSTSPCASMATTLMPNSGVDLAADGGKILDAAFKGQNGIGVASLNTATGALDLTYCSSSQTQDSVRQLLTASGLVTIAGAPASVPATVTPVP